MDQLFASMDKFNKKQMSLSELLLKLEARFRLADVEPYWKKIDLCWISIGNGGENIINSLPDRDMWEEAKATFLQRTGAGSLQEDAFLALQDFKCQGRDIEELGGEAEKQAKGAFPGVPDIAQRQAIDAFIKALKPPLSIEVQKIGLDTLEEFISIARRLERLPLQYLTSSLEVVTAALQEEIKALK